AEDGIRDFHVTGVQTCALPILEVALTAGVSVLLGICVAVLVMAGVPVALSGIVGLGVLVGTAAVTVRVAADVEVDVAELLGVARSEERRVGEECRARGGAGS